MNPFKWRYALAGGASLLAIAYGGCSASDQALTAVRSAAEFAVAVEPLMIAVYREQQAQCLQKPENQGECVAAVRAAWDPIIAKYDAARTAWCAVDKAIGQGKCP